METLSFQDSLITEETLLQELRNEKKYHSFEIIQESDKSSHVFATKNADDKKMWISVLRNLRMEANKRRGSSVSSPEGTGGNANNGIPRSQSIESLHGKKKKLTFIAYLFFKFT